MIISMMEPVDMDLDSSDNNDIDNDCGSTEPKKKLCQSSLASYFSER